MSVNDTMETRKQTGTMTENKNKVGFYVNIDYKQPWARNGNKQADMKQGNHSTPGQRENQGTTLNNLRTS